MGFITIPQGHCALIERFGKAHRVINAGVTFLIPFLDSVKRLNGWGSVANKDGWIIELTQQQLDTPARSCHSKDNVPVVADASIYWQIKDPMKAVYAVDILPVMVADTALNSLRTYIGKLTLDELLSERQQLNQKIVADLAQYSTQWGIEFTRVEIQQLETSGDAAKAMLQEMEAERRRRAAIADAKGQAEAAVTAAHGAKEAMLIEAQGKKEQAAILAEADIVYYEGISGKLTEKEALKMLAIRKAQETYREMCASPAAKVFMPNTLVGMVDSMANSRSGGNG